MSFGLWLDYLSIHLSLTISYKQTLNLGDYGTWKAAKPHMELIPNICRKVLRYTPPADVFQNLH